LVPVPTLNTPTTTLLLVPDKNANCRRGPGTVYSVLTSVLAGQTVELSGRNEENTWWFTVLPGNNRCWISMVAGLPDGDPMLLPILQAPPTPVPTQADSGCSQYQSVADCTAAGCSWNMNQNACH
jgi:hypothetical protein